MSIDSHSVYLIANGLLANLVNTIPKFSTASIIGTIDGESLVNATYKNPFTFKENSPLLHGHNVKQDGTGLVHTAPAFGPEDFKLALQYNLKTECVIDENGCYSKNDDNLKKLDLNGKNSTDAKTIEIIESILNNKMIHKYEYIHSYPYDWRTKKPVIIRSSRQWFIDTDKLKHKALEALENVKVHPQNQQNSMSSRISVRPFWCISRQRVWGLPIPCLFTNGNEENAIIDQELVDKVKSLIKKDGNVDFWWSNKYDKELAVKEGTFKSKDIFDIWFDSGSTFNTVIKDRQADLYLEGVDQFNGWFQSSLLLSVALNQKSPYKSILVHGYVVDEKDQKMSKSIGNVIEPMQAIKGHPKKDIPQCGLDVLRFWTAIEFPKGKIPIGSEILKKMQKRVFEIRKVIGFVIANTSDVPITSTDSGKQLSLVDYNLLLPIDKYILYNLYTLLNTCSSSYDEMSFNKAMLSLENFITVDLSAFYIRSIKDRLYCELKASCGRRSAQTALVIILHSLITIMAPVMPHLAEEAYINSILKQSTEESLPSLFQNKTFNFSNNEQWNNEEVANLFKIINHMKDSFDSLLPSENTAKYEIEIKCDLKNKIFDQLGQNYSSWLTECFGCSTVNLIQINTNELSETGIKTITLETNENTFSYLINVKNQSNKHTCARCRRYINEKSDCLCKRCEQVLANL